MTPKDIIKTQYVGPEVKRMAPRDYSYYGPILVLDSSVGKSISLES